jgi:hypothetical protein
MNNVLLIIGNGFDLQCKLPSSYNDYFNYCSDDNIWYKKYLVKGSTILTRIIEDRNMNIKFLDRDSFFENFTMWDLLFITSRQFVKGEVRWCDIEKEIDKSLKLDESGKSLWRDVQFRVQTAHRTLYMQGENYFSERINLLALLFICRYDIDYKNLNEEYMHKLIFEELTIFEKRFSDYISSKINDEYRKKAKKLFSVLFSLDGNKTNGKNSLRTVISFNYTPLANDMIPFGLCSSFNNVHGIVGTDICDIIFGIDDYIVEKDKKLYHSSSVYFSKSYRKIKKLHASDMHDKSLLKENINNIVIYGHSLNSADYSYFQSIFDFYKLYENKSMNIWFAYTKHEHFVEDEYYRSIRNLIQSYGNTLDNMNHGKNLFHKLLLENRIKLVECSID